MTTRKGRLLINTGDGKGKTTAALGLALRAVGQGMRVLIVQFIKGDWPTGELRTLERLAPEVTVATLGKGFTWEHEDLEQDRVAAATAWDLCRRALSSGEYDLVVMDEINYAIAYHLLDVADVAAALKERKAEVHVVLTGGNVHPDLIALADTVTEMRAIKHAFRDEGTKAMRGIEY
jgi:cob(I)alamin adenosyltransferase